MVVLFIMETPVNHTEIYADLMKKRFELSQTPPIYESDDIKCYGCESLENTVCAWYCDRLKCSLEDGSVMAFKCLSNSCLSEAEKENLRIEDAMNLLFSYSPSVSQSQTLHEPELYLPLLV